MTGERDVFSVNELVTTDNWYPKSQTCLRLVWVSARDVRNGFEKNRRFGFSSVLKRTVGLVRFSL